MARRLWHGKVHVLNENRTLLGEFTARLETDAAGDGREWWDGDLEPATNAIQDGDSILLRFEDGSEARATAHSPVLPSSDAPFIPIDGHGDTPF